MYKVVGGVNTLLICLAEVFELLKATTRWRDRRFISKSCNRIVTFEFTSIIRAYTSNSLENLTFLSSAQASKVNARNERKEAALV